MAAYYYTVTTIVTVGYGDILPRNIPERIFSTLLMLIGVASFGLATGYLASIITNYDSSQAILKEKYQTLYNLQRQYRISGGLFKKLVKTLHFNHNKMLKDFDQFMSELPYRLRIEVAMEIHKKIYETVVFF